MDTNVHFYYKFYKGMYYLYRLERPPFGEFQEIEDFIIVDTISPDVMGGLYSGCQFNKKNLVSNLIMKTLGAIAVLFLFLIFSNAIRAFHFYFLDNPIIALLIFLIVGFISIFISFYYDYDKIKEKFLMMKYNRKMKQHESMLRD